MFFAIFFLAKSPNPPHVLLLTSKNSYKSGTGMDSDFPISASVALSPRKMASFRLLKSRGLMSSSGITLKKGVRYFSPNKQGIALQVASPIFC